MLDAARSATHLPREQELYDDGARWVTGQAALVEWRDRVCGSPSSRRSALSTHHCSGRRQRFHSEHQSLPISRATSTAVGLQQSHSRHTGLATIRRSRNLAARGSSGEPTTWLLASDGGAEIYRAMATPAPHRTIRDGFEHDMTTSSSESADNDQGRRFGAEVPVAARWLVQRRVLAADCCLRRRDPVPGVPAGRVLFELPGSALQLDLAILDNTGRVVVIGEAKRDTVMLHRLRASVENRGTPTRHLT
jgi:hypothetical protein